MASQHHNGGDLTVSSPGSPTTLPSVAFTSSQRPTMMFIRPFPFVSPLLTLLPLLLSLPCISTSTNHYHENKESNANQLQSTSTDPSERESLFKVLESLSSDRDWRASNPDPCRPGSSWPGIECKLGRDNRLHVTRLDFGTSPNPSCKKAATFPSEIFDLPYLESLFFLNCFKATKTSFTIPPKIRNPATLQQLSLKSNPALVGVIPTHISSLKSLQVLTLSQNHLVGKIPEGISALTSLVHLDLSYNSFSGSIPSQMGKLKSLVDLDLSYNSLTGNIPPSIGQMGLLQKLDLSSNSLTGAIPETLESLSLLSFLALSSNRLSGQFPKDLQKLQNLQYLIMDDNPMFKPLPFQLGTLPRLQELRLANSGYTGRIPASFAWLVNLTTLSLENNRLTGEIPPGLSGLSRIYHLNLSRNLLGGVVPFNAGFLKRLGRNLDLSGNPGLCLNGSDRSEDVKVGIAVCGVNRSASSLTRPVDKSSGAPFRPSLLFLVLGYPGIWGLYPSLFQVGL